MNMRVVEDAVGDAGTGVEVNDSLFRSFVYSAVAVNDNNKVVVVRCIA